MTFQEQKDYLKAGNYLFFPNDIISYNLSPKALSVFVYLVYLSDDMGECHPARKTIGDHCGGISRSTVDRALKELVDKGLIEIEKRYKDNIQITSSYSLCHLGKWHTKQKIIYNLVADINGILENDKRRGTKYLDGKLD